MLPNHRTLKHAARQSLANASCRPGRLILIHTGVVLLFTAITVVVDYLLEQGIGATGGLRGMGSRAILTTIQTVLQLTQTVLLPFWQIGYIYAALRIAKDQPACPADLAQGFRRFFCVLRLQLITGLFLFILLFICSYVASFIFMITPWGSGITMHMMELMEAGAEIDMVQLEQTVYDMMMENIVPLMGIFLLCFLSGAAPILFRMRFAEHAIMNGCNRVFVALRISWKATRRNCKKLLKLDLSFWWFYALEILLAAICYGDVLLAYLGISLPLTAEAAYFGCFGIYIAGQLILYCLCRNRVAVTYAKAYLNLTTR